MPFWNCGVVAIANDAAGKALAAAGGAWHAEWVRFPGGWDEMAMLRALKTLGVTPATLDAKYNDQTLPPKESGAVIEHWVGGMKLLPEFQAGL